MEVPRYQMCAEVVPSVWVKEGSNLHLEIQCIIMDTCWFEGIVYRFTVCALMDIHQLLFVYSL